MTTGGGGKFWSKKGPVTRDGIYERPLMSDRFRSAFISVSPFDSIPLASAMFLYVVHRVSATISWMARWFFQGRVDGRGRGEPKPTAARFSSSRMFDNVRVGTVLVNEVKKWVKEFL